MDGEKLCLIIQRSNTVGASYVLSNYTYACDGAYHATVHAQIISAM